MHKKVLVHFHLFYHEQIDYFIDKLSNINSCEWDLFVTYVEENQKSFEKLKTLKSDVQLVKVDNVGYDIFPFINLIKNIDLEKYDYVLKIHTKNALQTKVAFASWEFLHTNKLTREDWRNFLVEALIGSKEIFKANLETFETQKDIGYIADSTFSLSWVENCKNAKIFNEYKNKLQLNAPKHQKYTVGTMFFCRAEILKPIKSWEFEADTFKSENHTGINTTLAHYIDTIFSCLVYHAGYEIKEVTTPLEKEFFSEVYKNEIAIAFASDNNYFPYTEISILSILKNKKENTKYHFYILHPDNLDVKKKNALTQLIKNYNCCITYINMRNQFANVRMTISHITTPTYYRLCLPELLEYHKKVIYLDSDIIVNSDLSELYNIEIGNNYIAGVIAPYSKLGKRFNLPKEYSDTYINAGMTVWNLEKMRTDDIQPKLIEAIDKNYPTMDQDIINVVCKEHIYVLPPKYNLMTKYDTLWDKVYEKEIYNKTDLDVALKSPTIIHYADSRKPWNHNNVMFANKWWKYAKISPYYKSFKKEYDKICWNKFKKEYQEKIKYYSDKILSAHNVGTHKVISILGIKMKFKSEKLQQREQMNKLFGQLNNLKKLSNSQNQKINSLTELSACQNEKIENLIRVCEKQNKKIETLVSKSESNENNVNVIKEKINRYHNENIRREEELLYRNVLVDSGFAPWVKNPYFTLIKGSANYSFIFNLLKILDLVKPDNILEFGLGQTSVLTAQYSDFYKKDLTIVEHNQEWIDLFGAKIKDYSNHNIVQKDLIKFELNGVESDKYCDLSDITEGKKYNLIVIDGPFGFDRIYPRTNILDLIPQNLADDFVIILDDAERQGEKNTANLIFEKLDENNLKYKKSYKLGTKTQLVISSINYEFVHWY